MTPDFHDAMAVLNYHGLESRPDEYPWLEEETAYVVGVTHLISQLEAAAKLGFYTLSLSEIGDWSKGQKAGKVFMITFDDGMKCHYEHALPALQKRGFKAVFFVPAGLVGRKGQMSWDELRALKRAGFDIGSHGLRHVALTDLTEGELREEFRRSKEILEDGLGAPVESFSIPRGYYENRFRNEAEKAGYRFLFTSAFDLNLRQGLDPLCLNRMTIKKETHLPAFQNLLEGRLGFRRPWEMAKARARAVVPPAFYDALAFAKRKVRGC